MPRFGVRVPVGAPIGPLGEMVDAEDLKSSAYGVSVRVRQGAPSSSKEKIDFSFLEGVMKW